MDKEFLRKLPDSPGVYLMKDNKEGILYIGKAKSLKHRVRSYFSGSSNHSYRIERMISNIYRVDFIVTKNEIEALILESNLIKNHKPRFNVLLKDDKHYPYLKMATNETFPYLQVVRRVKKDGGTYFGPYPSSKSLKETLKLIHRIFKLRHSKDTLYGSEKRRPCLNYQMKLCVAPCAGYISVEEYGNLVREALLFLKGKNSELIERLRNKMDKASKSLQFEEAAAIRDQIIPIERFMEKQLMLSVGMEERDVIALGREGNIAVVQILFIRSGKVVGDKSVYFRKIQGVDEKEILSAFITQYYSGDVLIPEELIIEMKIDDMEGIAMLLKEKRGNKISIIAPKKGIKKELVGIAKENAMNTLRMEIDSMEEAYYSMRSLREELKLKNIPERIEAFDISTISGGATAVGAMAVFLDGKAVKNKYKRYRIKNINKMDDLSMMREILTRRFREVIDSKMLLPDLIIVDGGKGQLSVAKSVLDSLEIEGVDLIGIAKGRERNNPDTDEIYTSCDKVSILLPSYSSGKKLVQRVRDEAHRFSITYHRNLRKKETLASRLDSIPGIGPKRKKALLRHFGSLKGVRNASAEQIMEALRVGERTARGILEKLDA